ncbi:hypothetical protein SY212_12940 [Ligilactobacillus agilis]|uniref:Uncharacterized protein n=1 Tax=Ligilactobacillus agilis TaxID=1601 RepID=A0A6F9XLW8_9LACO|nr:hypothetical protein [Ligilactobacillus agilis]GET06264.1 hypothetical protein SY212_12940 [Ligilactobacillus agilis]
MNNNVTFQSYPLQIQNAVQEMNKVFDTPKKRAFAANKARIHLQTRSNAYSEAYAQLLKSLGLTSRVQDEYTQKLVAFYFHAKQHAYFNGKSMLEDFNNNGKLSHFFTSYR